MEQRQKTGNSLDWRWLLARGDVHETEVLVWSLSFTPNTLKNPKGILESIKPNISFQGWTPWVPENRVNWLKFKQQVSNRARLEPCLIKPNCYGSCCFVWPVSIFEEFLLCLIIHRPVVELPHSFKVTHTTRPTVYGLERQVSEKRGEEGEDGKKKEEEERREKDPICLFFIHFFLFLVFVVVARGLHCFVQDSYSCGKQDYSLLGCTGCSLWWLLLLGSAALECRFSSCGTWA